MVVVNVMWLLVQKMYISVAVYTKNVCRIFLLRILRHVPHLLGVTSTVVTCVTTLFRFCPLCCKRY